MFSEQSPEQQDPNSVSQLDSEQSMNPQKIVFSKYPNVGSIEGVNPVYKSFSLDPEIEDNRDSLARLAYDPQSAEIRYQVEENPVSLPTINGRK